MVCCRGLRPFLEATVAVSSDTLDFLAEVAVATDTVELTISNFGLETLTINDLQVSGTDFQLTSSPTFPIELNYQDNFTGPLVFSPSAQGEATGTLNVLSDDPLNPTKSVYLRGTGFVINPAEEGVIYAVTGVQSDGVLLTLDQNTGSGSIVGATRFNELTGVTIRPSNGELFGTVKGSISTMLVRIDAEAGQSYETAVIPVSNIRAIAFDLNDDLYGTNFNDGDLYLIDPATGDTTFIGSTGINLFLGLAINPLDGTLWGTAITDAIYKINKSTAEATLIGNTGFSRTPEIVFDAEGKLFGLSGFAPTVVSELIQIDPSTGIGTVIGSTGFKTVFGLAVKGTVVTGIDELIGELLPAKYDLHQNYPNPFNPTTTVTYDLPKDTKVVLKIYNVLGQEIRTLVNENQTAGYKSIVWNGKDNLGQIVGSGVYMYRLQVGDKVQIKKMLILK